MDDRHVFCFHAEIEAHVRCPQPPDSLLRGIHTNSSALLWVRLSTKFWWDQLKMWGMFHKDRLKNCDSALDPQRASGSWDSAPIWCTTRPISETVPGQSPHTGPCGGGVWPSPSLPCRSHIYNRYVRTERGLKRAYATSHANVGIYKNKLDGKMCVFPNSVSKMGKWSRRR